MAPDAETSPPLVQGQVQRHRDEFALRIVTIDYYLAKPIPGLDVTHSAFLSAPVDRVRTRHAFT